MNARPDEPVAVRDVVEQAAEPSPEPIFVGRRLEIDRIANALLAGSSVVVKGKAGIGKRTLMHRVRARLRDRRLCLAPSVSTAKQMTADLAEQIHAAVGLKVPERLIPPRFRAAAKKTGTIAYRHIKRSLSREPVPDQLALIVASIARHDDVILFVDSLEIPPTQADMLSRLSEHCQLAACMEDLNRRTRIQRLLWKFQLTLDLKPLVRTETRAWVEQWLRQHPIVFDSGRIRAAFIRAIVRDSGGIPAAVQGMLDLALIERTVTRETIRDIGHEAAISYLDMTPILLIIVACFMALRYIGRGMGMQELMVLAGVSTSLFSVLLFFMRTMRSR